MSNSSGSDAIGIELKKVKDLKDQNRSPGNRGRWTPPVGCSYMTIRLNHSFVTASGEGGGGGQ